MSILVLLLVHMCMHCVEHVHKVKLLDVKVYACLTLVKDVSQSMCINQKVGGFRLLHILSALGIVCIFIV